MLGDRGVSFRNDSKEVIPAFAIMRITGFTSTDNGNDIIYTVKKPNGTFQPIYLINGPQPVPVTAGQYTTYGVGYFGIGNPVLAQCDTPRPDVDMSDPGSYLTKGNMGPFVGAQADHWSLTNCGYGFICFPSDGTFPPNAGNQPGIPVGEGFAMPVLQRFVSSVMVEADDDMGVGVLGDCTVLNTNGSLAPGQNFGNISNMKLKAIVFNQQGASGGVSEGDVFWVHWYNGYWAYVLPGSGIDAMLTFPGTASATFQRGFLTGSA